MTFTKAGNKKAITLKKATAVAFFRVIAFLFPALVNVIHSPLVI